MLSKKEKLSKDRILFSLLSCLKQSGGKKDFKMMVKHWSVCNAL